MRAPINVTHAIETYYQIGIKVQHLLAMEYPRPNTVDFQRANVLELIGQSRAQKWHVLLATHYLLLKKIV